MGSEKYPDENGFDSFIKKYGGGSNAFTECERASTRHSILNKLNVQVVDGYCSTIVLLYCSILQY